MRNLISVSALILAACSPSSDTAFENEDIVLADTVFSGGTIYTGLDDFPTVEFVAVENGRILYAGDELEGLMLVGQDTRQVNLDGAVMFPGFTDSHAHLIGIGQRECSLNLEDVTSIDDLKMRVAEAAENTIGPIYGRGWIETHWPEDRFPNASDLDEIVSDRPVILERADGHAVVVNTAALEAAGITNDTPDPSGGEILRDETGQATGMLIDAAMGPVNALLEAPTPAERAEYYEIGADVMASYGWTGIHNMSVPPGDVALLETLEEEDRLAIRSYNAVNPNGYDLALEERAEFDAVSRETTRSVKLYVDGALGSRGAALLEPYSDSPGSRGLTMMEEIDAVAFMEQALRDGVQLAVHAIGDRGNRLVLDWMEAAMAAVPVEDRAIAEPRWRIEHAQILHPDDIARFGELGVIASMQPSHAIGDLHFAPSRLGQDRLEGAYAWRSLIYAGAIVVGGSDAPVERGEARIEYYAATIRQDLQGFSGEGWHPEEAVDRQTGLKMFTIWPAVASFREDDLGTIEEGKLADFSIFDRDLMTVSAEDLREARPVMTVVGGEIVFQAE